jgi:sulfide:quinone oxidoreductase
MTTNVLIAGGGPAGLEAALALHRLAGDLVATTVLAPETHLTYRPLSVRAPFSHGEAPSYRLDRIAADNHFDHVQDRLSSVDPITRTVTTRAGDTLNYDALVVACGAQPLPPPRGRTAFGGSPTDQERFHGIVQDVEGGYLRRIAFVVPEGRSWPLPLYELALMLSERAHDMWVTPELHLVTPEPAPLAVFGPQASRKVASLLELAKITVHTNSTTVPENMDRVVTLPRLRGPSIAGLPADDEGFLLTDNCGRVRGVEHVYAAGDATAFPLKQGGIGCRQADAAAAHIAAHAGAGNPLEPFTPDLQGLLLTGHEARFLRRGAKSEPLRLWSPTAKIAARELTAYLDGVAASPP